MSTCAVMFMLFLAATLPVIVYAYNHCKDALDIRSIVDGVLEEYVFPEEDE